MSRRRKRVHRVVNLKLGCWAVGRDNVGRPVIFGCLIERYPTGMIIQNTWGDRKFVPLDLIESNGTKFNQQKQLERSLAQRRGHG